MRMISFAPVAVIAAAVLYSTPIQAAEVKVGDLVVLDAWARATPVKTGAAYIAVRNDGDAPDKLVGVATDKARMVHLHESKMDNGVMKMRAVDALDIPPHQTVTLKPGGYHIMLMGLSAPLKVGDSFPLTLTFAKAGTVSVDVQVKPAGDGGGDDSMGGMKMDMNHGNGN